MKISRILAVTLPLIVAMLLTSVLYPPAVLAQQSEGSLSGTVKDQNGDAVSGAEVTLLHPQQAVLRTTTTDSSGGFKFDRVQRGSYEIRISQAGFALQRLSVLLSAGDADLYVTLAVAPIS